MQFANPKRNHLFNRYQRKTLPFKEFIALMALMMSLVALSIDAILPALTTIGQAMNITHANEQQLIISYLFIGMALGQLLFGPLSDSIGRRKSLILGFTVFFIGSAMTLFATNFNDVLVSRFLQGIGVAAPRVLAMAIIRDQYAGRAMSRVMSFVMMIFILVPMLAPIFGQFILLLIDWQAIFKAVALIGIVTLVWFLCRQSETLNPDDRADFNITHIQQALKTIFTHHAAIGYTIAAGLMSGPFIFYLSSAQQLFQQQYNLGENFPLYFAGLSLAFGLASFVNSKYVMRLGMHKMIKISLSIMTATSLLAIIVVYFFNGLPPLWVTTIYMLASFFSLGLLFGNLNALAMEPLGHIAGIGAAIVGALSTLIAALLAILIGMQFNETLYPLVISFLSASIITLILNRWVVSKQSI